MTIKRMSSGANEWSVRFSSSQVDKRWMNIWNSAGSLNDRQIDQQTDRSIDTTQSRAWILLPDSSSFRIRKAQQQRLGKESKNKSERSRHGSGCLDNSKNWRTKLSALTDHTKTDHQSMKNGWKMMQNIQKWQTNKINATEGKMLLWKVSWYLKIIQTNN